MQMGEEQHAASEDKQAQPDQADQSEKTRLRKFKRVPCMIRVDDNGASVAILLSLVRQHAVKKTLND